MIRILDIIWQCLDTYPFEEGANPLELLQLFKTQFPERADLDRIQESILQVDLVYSSFMKAARLKKTLDSIHELRETIRKAPEKEVAQVTDAYRRIVELEVKVLDAQSRLLTIAANVDQQAVTVARQNLAMMAVELAKAGLVRLF